MIYSLHNRDRRFMRAVSYIEVQGDGTIVKATPAYRWAIGKKLAQFRSSSEKYGIEILVHKGHAPKSLKAGKYVPSKPSDKEVLIRSTSTDDLPSSHLILPRFEQE